VGLASVHGDQVEDAGIPGAVKVASHPGTTSPQANCFMSDSSRSDGGHPVYRPVGSGLKGHRIEAFT